MNSSLLSKEELHALRELMALMHGDGGHYVEKHGMEKALVDAFQLIHTKYVTNEHLTDINHVLNENKELKKRLQDLIDATKDQNGQFRAWHQHLKLTTNIAEETLNKINHV